MEPNNPLLDQYVIQYAGKDHPKVCFLPQASGEAESYVIKFYQAFTELGCVPSWLSLFRPQSSDLADYLGDKDIIYVGGGNTKSMLALWREWELDRILAQINKAGVVLTGLSAGAICWFEQGVTDSVPGQLGPLDCLGYLPGSCCPHYDGEAGRRPAYQALVTSERMLPGYGLDDGVALHYVDGQLQRIISSRLEAKAYQVDSELEREITPVYLGETRGE